MVGYSTPTGAIGVRVLALALLRNNKNILHGVAKWTTAVVSGTMYHRFESGHHDDSNVATRIAAKNNNNNGSIVTNSSRATSLGMQSASGPCSPSHQSYTEESSIGNFSRPHSSMTVSKAFDCYGQQSTFY